MVNQQRKGQWLYNKLRDEAYQIINDSEQEKIIIARRLWNMTNEEFDRIMSEYERSV